MDPKTPDRPARMYKPPKPAKGTISKEYPWDEWRRGQWLARCKTHEKNPYCGIFAGLIDLEQDFNRVSQ